MGVREIGGAGGQGLASPFLTINNMTITQDNNWYEVPTLAEKDKMKPNEEKNKTYWDKERLEKFWGRNPKQEFNDYNATQDEFNSLMISESSSGKKIRRFPSGAVRSDDTGRIRPDYLSPYGLAEIAEHFTIAKNDFGPTNYFKGIEPSEILPSVMRHMLEFQEGIMNGNKAMVRSALRSLGANAIMGLHQIVLEERGEYVKQYDKTELVDANKYLKELEDGKANG